LFSAGVPELIIIVGANPEAARAAVLPRDRRVQIIENPRWTSGQLSSLLAGLDAPSRMPLEAAMVTLVDVPFVAVETVQRLLRVWRETRAPIVRPARGDEHGHPVIFDRAIFDELRRADPGTGAKPVVRAHERNIVNVPVDDEGAFQDFDTPDEYARIGR
jgi:CTP:molybdopterin cytidylyltransferase MocA